MRKINFRGPLKSIHSSQCLIFLIMNIKKEIKKCVRDKSVFSCANFYFSKVTKIKRFLHNKFLGRLYLLTAI